MTYKLNGNIIEDVVSSSTSLKAQRNLIGNDPILISDLTITLQGLKYNPYNEYSPFYNAGNNLFKNIIFTIEDDTFETITATIREIEWDENNEQITLKLYPYVNSRLENTFAYYNDDITPAQAVREILELNGLSEFIDYPSFYNAIYNQNSAGLLVDITIDENSNTRIIDFLNTVATNTGADIYISLQNKIVYLQYNRYLNPVALADILDTQIIDMKIMKDSQDIINDFQLNTIYGPYYDSGLIGANSQQIFGKTSQLIDYTNTQNMTTDSIVGPLWAGENHIYRNRNPKWVVELSVAKLTYPLTLKDFFKISYYNDNIYEVVKVQYNENNGTIDITGVVYE